MNRNVLETTSTVLTYTFYILKIYSSDTSLVKSWWLRIMISSVKERWIFSDYDVNINKNWSNTLSSGTVLTIYKQWRWIKVGKELSNWQPKIWNSVSARTHANCNYAIDLDLTFEEFWYNIRENKHFLAFFSIFYSL